MYRVNPRWRGEECCCDLLTAPQACIASRFRVCCPSLWCWDVASPLPACGFVKTFDLICRVRVDPV